MGIHHINRDKTHQVKELATPPPNAVAQNTTSLGNSKVALSLVNELKRPFLERSLSSVFGMLQLPSALSLVERSNFSLKICLTPFFNEMYAVDRLTSMLSHPAFSSAILRDIC